LHTLQPFGVGGWQGTAGEVGQVLAGLYRYDQLNRLRQMRTRAGLDDATNDWTTLPTPTGADADKYLSTYAYDANGNIEAADRYDQNGDHYDDLEYFYHKSGSDLVRNRLYHLKDHADATNTLVNEGPSGAVDLDHRQVTFYPDIDDINEDNNYRYDELGNLIQDLEEGIAGIDWTVAGKVKAVTRAGGSTLQPMEFAYGAGGQRTEKTVGAGADLIREHYVRDAQGNVMALYRYQPGGGNFTLKERALYGSSRLGRYVEEVEFIPPPTIPQTQAADDRRLQYEMTDHLGNVSTVVTGRLLIGNGAPHEAQVLSAQGYEPFGSLMPGRNYSSSSYRFGFNGQEKDDEMHGATGTSYDFGARIYDLRVARFLSIDPKAPLYPYWTPYLFAGNNPIRYVDLFGEGPGDKVKIRDVTAAFNSKATGSVFKITHYIDQPGSGGDRDTWEGWPTDPDVGHTFIKLTQVNEDGSQIERIVGFYPDSSVDLDNPEGLGAFVDDDGHEYDVSIGFTLDANQFQATLDYLNGKDGAMYILNSQNCTDVGLGCASASGSPLPDTEGTWGGANIMGYRIPEGRGSNPGDAGEDIRALPGANSTKGVARAENKGAAAPNAGGNNGSDKKTKKL